MDNELHGMLQTLSQHVSNASCSTLFTLQYEQDGSMVRLIKNRHRSSFLELGVGLLSLHSWWNT